MGTKRIQGNLNIEGVLNVDEIYLGEDDNVVINEEGITINGKKVIIEGEESESYNDLTDKPVIPPSIETIEHQYAISSSNEKVSTVETWDKVTSPLTQRERSCIYANGYYVVCGLNGEVGYSQDGLSWTTVEPLVSGALTNITYGKGKFIIVDQYNGLWVAESAPISWTKIDATFENAIGSLVYANNRFVIAGDHIAAFSEDGIVWTVVETPGNYNQITFGGGRYVAVGVDGSVGVSYDGVTWVDHSNPNVTVDLRAVTYAKGRYIIGGLDGLIMYTEDFVTWGIATSNSAGVRYIRQIAYAENQYYAATYTSAGTGEIWVSNDGITWVVQQQMTVRLWCLAYNNGKLITAGDSGSVYILDFGIEWLDNTPDLTDGQYLWERVVTTLTDGSKIVSDSTLACASSGSSKATIDVTELPTENIDTNSFYRVPTGTFYAGIDNLPWVCNVVETLPSEGVPVTSDMENFTFYYETTTKSSWAYVDETLSAEMGIDVGWLPMETVASLLELSWGGIVYDENAIPPDSLSLLIEYKLYQYKDYWDNISGSVGWAGTGRCAEIFNTSRNIARGEYSHAEGYMTQARGEYSHAEGAESVAEGDSSHAEGNMTFAKGSYSHAEGQDTVANGVHSHAEGYWTIANGEHQHVQGKYNIEDNENKYAHIVGNGNGTRSNAHTLDWQGNAWFQGKVKVGGTGQDDPSAKTLATIDEVNAKVSKFVINTSPSTTVIDMINSIIDAGGVIDEWNIIILAGYNVATFGLQISSWGEPMYAIQGINLITGTKIAEGKDWTGVTISSFLGMFKSPIPTCTLDDIGKLLTVSLDSNGTPQATWTTIPNAEGSGF